MFSKPNGGAWQQTTSGSAGRFKASQGAAEYADWQSKGAHECMHTHTLVDIGCPVPTISKTLKQDKTQTLQQW